jgi:hypothetical protein
MPELRGKPSKLRSFAVSEKDEEAENDGYVVCLAQECLTQLGIASGAKLMVINYESISSIFVNLLYKCLRPRNLRAIRNLNLNSYFFK